MGAAHKRYYYSDAAAHAGAAPRTRRVDAREYYTHGAHAHKLEPIREPVPAPYYGPLVRVERKKVKLPSISFGKLVCALAICLSFIGIVYIKSQVYHSQLENSRLENALEEKKENTEAIIAQNTEKADVAYIEEVARTRLNMAKPQSYQIVYINVPKTDYTVVHDAPIIVEKEKFGLASMKGVMDKVTGNGEKAEDEAADAQTSTVQAK